MTTYPAPINRIMVLCGQAVQAGHQPVEVRVNQAALHALEADITAFRGRIHAGTPLPGDEDALQGLMKLNLIIETPCDAKGQPVRIITPNQVIAIAAVDAFARVHYHGDTHVPQGPPAFVEIRPSAPQQINGALAPAPANDTSEPETPAPSKDAS